jgi:CMP-2-keto-3-deoxyoctulosonic acid synthetase
LEQLRLPENGIPIQWIRTSNFIFDIDTPKGPAEAEKLAQPYPKL